MKYNIAKAVFFLFVLPFLIFSIVFKIGNDLEKQSIENAYKENAYWEELCSPYANTSEGNVPDNCARQ